VLVASDDLILLDEVIRHLEEIPHWKLLRSARSADELLGRPARPDCVVASEAVALQLADHPRRSQLSAGLVVFGRQETASAPRAALKLGARGFVQWPDERGQLRGLVERGCAVQAPTAVPAGALHAVWAPKGGSGATVISAHLAGALATLKRKAILVDLDLDHADQTSVLGADPEHKTVGDLLRVADELSGQTVSTVLWSHPLGFSAVLAPGRIGDTASAEASRISSVLGTIRQAADHLVVDLPSGLNPVAVSALLDSTSIEVVLTPDLLGLRRTRDLLKGLDSHGVHRDRMNIVLNQAGGPDITEKEVEAVLGVSSVIRIRADLRIYRAVNRGELSPVACKLLAPLARRLAAHSGAEAQPEPAGPATVAASARPVRVDAAEAQPVVREVRPVARVGRRREVAPQPVLEPAASPAARIPDRDQSNPLQARRTWRSGGGGG
ncbi:MAG TPA: AAA family ATPase, partial [Actinomycetota bacterium]|nr:AAA family ATPase [Actinomycetota bacterium]